MVSILIRMIAGNFMCVTVEHNPFDGVKKEWFGMKQRLVVVCRIIPYVQVDGKNGDEMRVG